MGKRTQECIDYQRLRAGSKESVRLREAASAACAPKLASAVSAKAGNAASEFFQQTHDL